MSDKFLVDDLDGDDRILIAELVKRVYNKYPEIVYHYTSLDSAIKIIDSKVIHFRDSRLLADNTEQRNVFNILNEMISMDEYSDDFKRYAYQICQDEYLDQYISSDLQNNRFSDISRFFVFSCSFDEHSEYLISTYAKRNNPIGCRITINAKDLGEQFYPQYLEIVPIIYNEQDKRALVKLIVDHAYLKFKRAMSDEDKKTAIGLMVSYLMYLGIYLKSEEYSKENEVRILLVEDNDSRQDLSEFKKDDYRYELPIVEHFCTEFKTM